MDRTYLSDISSHLFQQGPEYVTEESCNTQPNAAQKIRRTNATFLIVIQKTDKIRENNNKDCLYYVLQDSVHDPQHDPL